MARNFYEILGVSPQATQSQIELAYKNLTTNNKLAYDENTLKIICKAYETLSDKNTRSSYDLRLARATRTTTGGLKETIHQSSLIFLLASFLCISVILNIQKSNNINIAETKLAKTEKLLSEKAAALDEVMNILELQQSELEKVQVKSTDIEKQQADLIKIQSEYAKRQQELEERRIELQEKSINMNRDIANKQIDTQSTVMHRGMDIYTPKIQSETRATHGVARNLEIEAKQKEYNYDRRVQDERTQIMRESALLNKYREQRRNGEDGITTSNPGARR
jgi:hypothetical protein